MTSPTKEQAHTATPGPWAVVPATNKGIVLFHTVDPADNGKWRGSVASVHSAEHIDGISVEERDANARLIAASPELADCVYDLLALHEAHHNHPLHAAARALLARATGAAK